MHEPASPATGVSLRQLLDEACVVGADDIVVTRCTSDSRRTRPGDLFVALPGVEHDGHEYIADAVRRGAAAVLASRPAPGVALPVCYVDDTRAAYGQLCQALAGQPSRAVKVVGITGTNGKTTTSILTASALQAAGHAPGVIGTLGIVDGREVDQANWTTPPAHVLASAMRRMADNGCTHAVMEVSSHALAQSRVAGIEFDVAAFTNVRHDHLDYHGSLANYRAAKARLLDHLSPEGFAILNADDELCRSLLARVDGPVLTVGIDRPAELSAHVLERCASEQTFLLSAGDETFPVRTRLIGEHNVSNCLVAAAIGLAYGIDLATIVRGIEAVDHVPGRLERVECGQPFAVFVDYAHTPDALSSVLETLREVTHGRLICVFGAGGDRDKLKRPAMGRAVERAADLAIVTNDNPRSEDPRKIAEQIISGCRASSAIETIEDRGLAIRWALAQATEGDTVLIAGKGHETHQIIGDEQREFDDRAVAKEWLHDTYRPRRIYRASA